MMSRDARMAAVGAVIGTAWSVFVALSIDAPITRWALVAISIVVPAGLWLAAARLRSRGAVVAASKTVTWSLPAAMIIVFVVDFVAWAVEQR